MVKDELDPLFRQIILSNHWNIEKKRMEVRPLVGSDKLGDDQNDGPKYILSAGKGGYYTFSYNQKEKDSCPFIIDRYDES